MFLAFIVWVWLTFMIGAMVVDVGKQSPQNPLAILVCGFSFIMVQVGAFFIFDYLLTSF